MFNIGFMEWILVMAIALLLIGPEQIPKAAQMAGQFINELKRIIDSIKTEHTRQPPKQIPQQPIKSPEKTDHEQSKNESS